MLRADDLNRTSRDDQAGAHRTGTLLLVLVLTLAVPGCGNGRAETAGPTLRDAENRYANLDLDGAREQFSRVMEDRDASAKDRAEAARRLSTIAWRFDKSPGGARVLLERARTLGLEATDFFFEKATLVISAVQ